MQQQLLLQVLHSPIRSLMSASILQSGEHRYNSPHICHGYKHIDLRGLFYANTFATFPAVPTGPNTVVGVSMSRWLVSVCPVNGILQLYNRVELSLSWYFAAYERAACLKVKRNILQNFLLTQSAFDPGTFDSHYGYL